MRAIPEGNSQQDVRVRAQNRRWFAFRLRTLFVSVTVVTLPLVWVASSLNWIRERHQLLIPMSSKRGVKVGNIQYTPGSYEDARPPWQLTLLGEQGITRIWVSAPVNDEQLMYVRALFPEAEVVVSVMRADGPWQTTPGQP